MSVIMPIFNVIDEYIRIILTSWPAVVLILSIIILLRHKKEIDERIKNIKSVGPHGTEFYPSGPPDSKSVIATKPETEKISKTESKIAKTKGTSVLCKIASSFPGTIVYDLVKDGKVWFSIVNPEAKRYKAYVKIKFITEGYKKELDEGYYGGIKAWNLNAFSGIQAPGLGIPNEIKEATRQKKRIKIEINCIVKNENDELIEEKLPMGYIYDYKNNSWYYEP